MELKMMTIGVVRKAGIKRTLLWDIRLPSKKYRMPILVQRKTRQKKIFSDSFD